MQSNAAKILNIPLVVTEQHPKGLGATVHELDVSHAAVHVPKTLFSMHVPQVQSFLTTRKITNVVLFGIEVRWEPGMLDNCIAPTWFISFARETMTDPFHPVTHPEPCLRYPNRS